MAGTMTRLDLEPFNGGYVLIVETGGKRLPLLDGSGDPHVFSKSEVHGWRYGMRGTNVGRAIDFLLSDA